MTVNELDPFIEDEIKNVIDVSYMLKGTPYILLYSKPGHKIISWPKN